MLHYTSSVDVGSFLVSWACEGCHCAHPLDLCDGSGGRGTCAVLDEIRVVHRLHTTQPHLLNHTRIPPYPRNGNQNIHQSFRPSPSTLLQYD
jgi:hypothetical protein